MRFTSTSYEQIHSVKLLVLVEEELGIMERTSDGYSEPLFCRMFGIFLHHWRLACISGCWWRDT